MPELSRRRSPVLALASFALMGSILFLLPSLAVASPAAPGLDSRLKASHLVNFLRYTHFPARHASAGPFVITIVGSGQMERDTRTVAAATGRINGRPVLVRRIQAARGSAAAPIASERDRASLAQLRSSHIVYFERGVSAAALDQSLGELWEYPVLTVSDIRGFTSRGGMLGLAGVDGRVVFEANPAAIRNARLVVSAKVLKLARLGAGASP